MQRVGIWITPETCTLHSSFGGGLVVDGAGPRRHGDHHALPLALRVLLERALGGLQPADFITMPPGLDSTDTSTPPIASREPHADRRDLVLWY